MFATEFHSACGNKSRLGESRNMSVNSAQIRAFHAVAASGSFTRAAEMLHLTQPTLSTQVKDLEQRFSIQLFKRRSRGIELTELGHRLYESTLRINSAESEIEQLLSAARSLNAGELKIGADAPYHVMPLVALFTRRYPGVRVSTSFGNSAWLLRQLVDRQFDVALAPNIKNKQKCHTVPLKPDNLVLFVAAGHPWSTRRSVRLEELKTQTILLREKGSTTRAILEQALSRSGIKLKQSLEIGSREAIREAVAVGLGAGVVPISEHGYDSRFHFLAVRDAKLTNQEYVVCRKSDRVKPVVRAFLELVPEPGR